MGDTAWAQRAIPAPGDFRASGSLDRGGTIDTNPAEIDTRCISMAYELSDRLGFESMKYDFILKDGEPVLTEFDYPVGAGRIMRILDWPGTWNRELQWIRGIKFHGDAQVEVFLSRVRSTGTVPTSDCRIVPDRES